MLRFARCSNPCWLDNNGSERRGLDKSTTTSHRDMVIPHEFSALAAQLGCSIRCGRSWRHGAPPMRQTPYVSEIQAVLFDFGGVVLSSPFEAFARYEEENGLPPNLIRTLNSTNSDTNAWAQFERSDVDTSTFAELFQAEAQALGHSVDARAILAMLHGTIRPEMVEAIRRIRAAGLATACLTNNVRDDRDRNNTERRADVATVMDMFDAVVESSKVGFRKPETAFYERACELLSVTPTACVFLDDLGINLKPAAAMGMRTIKVGIGPTAAHDALVALESHIGISLRGPNPLPVVTANPWSTRTTMVAYENPWIVVEHNDVDDPSGRPGIYGVVRPRNHAIGIVAINADGLVPLVGQYRYTLGRYSWELPEGGGSKASTAVSAAERELREETGSSAANWLEIGRMDLSNSVTDEMAIMFLAWDLTAGETELESTEGDLRCTWVRFDELVERVWSGELTDSITVASVLRVELLRRRGELPRALQELLDRG